MARDAVSKEVYHRVIKGKKDIAQDAMVVAALMEFGKPCTSRELHGYMMKSGRKIELISLRRCLTDLSSSKRYDRPWTEKAGKKVCSCSGELVNTWQIYDNQLNLFQ